ncbi:MAG: hypothetical protein JO174_18245 [Herbaspirillum sp.]|nr:hypothetical protein [Herbaspirillum sp.]
MNLSTRTLIALCGAFIIAAPMAALAIVKPLRVAVPAWMPQITCVSEHLCLDDLARRQEAETLYQHAGQIATDAVGPFRHAPRLVFCSTRACADTFGLGQRAAMAAGSLGLAVAPRGWVDFYVAHEMIHHRQAEQWGNLAMLTRPSWLVEGMAYSLSGDPRRPLPGQLEAWRAGFERWRAQTQGSDLWTAAQAVR